jgi:hypothetical protein
MRRLTEPHRDLEEHHVAAGHDAEDERFRSRVVATGLGRELPEVLVAPSGREPEIRDRLELRADDGDATTVAGEAGQGLRGEHARAVADGSARCFIASRRETWWLGSFTLRLPHGLFQFEKAESLANVRAGVRLLNPVECLGSPANSASLGGPFFFARGISEGLQRARAFLLVPPVPYYQHRCTCHLCVALVVVHLLQSRGGGARERGPTASASRRQRRTLPPSVCSVTKTREHRALAQLSAHTAGRVGLGSSGLMPRSSDKRGSAPPTRSAPGLKGACRLQLRAP